MESLARLAAQRPVAITVLAVAVVLLGQMAWRQLPLDLLPDLESPTVLVSVTSGERPPLEMERLYGEAIERRLFTVRGIRAVEQVARTGRLVTRVTFEWGADMDLAEVEVQKAVGLLGTDPDIDEVLVRRFDPRQMPVLALGLRAPSGQPDLVDLRRVARRQVAPALERLEGVAQVRVVGGREAEVHVNLRQALLDAHGLTVAEVASRIAAANLDVDAGTLEDGAEVLVVRGLARFRSPGDVSDVVVRFATRGSGPMVPVRVSDLGEVRLGTADVAGLVRVDGGEGVGLEIFKEAGANTVSVSKTVRGALEHLDADLPGIDVVVASDEAAVVEAAIGDVQSAALFGIGLAVLVLIAFLRTPGPVLIVSAAVPVSLLAAVLGLKFSGNSLNLMTLGGLALGAGMLVDNAIVVVESIVRRRSAGDDAEEAAARGTGRVAGAIAASTLTTCVVFVPVLFIQGLAARLVSGLAFSVVVSLVASLAVAVLLIPALAKWLLPARPVATLDPGSRWMERVVGRLVDRAGVVVMVAVVVAIGAGFALAQLGTELMPPADPGQISARLVGPAGQRVERTERTVASVEAILSQASDDGVMAVVSEVGRVPEDDRFIREEASEENTARLRVRLDENAPRAAEVIAAASPAVDGLSGVQVQWDVGTSAIAVAMGTGGPPVVVELAGRALPDLRVGAERLQRALSERPELWNVRSSFEGGPPELHLVLRRAVADGLGVELNDVAAVVEAHLEGRAATVLTQGDEEMDIRLRLDRVSRDELTSIPLVTATGARVTVGEVADLVPVDGAREIFRRDQKRVARVTARMSDGVESPEARAAALEVIDSVELPPGTQVRLAGEEEERQRTFGDLRWAAGLAMLLVVMVLAGSFESLRHPLTVLAAVPLGLVGVAVALVPQGRPVGVMAALGIIVLAGVAVNDAILLVEEARRQRLEGLGGREAIARASGLRLRPILMTTATTVLALLPLALGVGEAAELRTPLALAVIGGLLASTAGALFVIPCLYALVEGGAASDTSR
jgi:HAE1 family hydrophobic/amphiphilic exporter-1